MKEKKNIKDSLIRPAKDAGKTMRLNHFLSNKYSIAVIVTIIDIFFFMACNYIVNTLHNIPLWLKDMGNPEKYMGLKNILPSLDKNSVFLNVSVAIIIGIIILLDIIIIYKIRTAYAAENFNVGQKGVASWTTLEEIQSEYKEIQEKNVPYPGKPGIIISRYKDKIYIDDSAVNNLIIGITRSGKDEMFVVPSIDVYSRAEKQPSIIIADPKLETYRTSKQTLEARGYKVYLLNLADPLHSMGFNPLSEIVETYKKKDYATAELLAQSFAYSVFNPDESTGDSQFFDTTSSALLTALILAHIEDCLRENEKNRQNGLSKKDYEKDINMFSIINLFTELGRQKIPNSPNLSMLDVYFTERPPLDRAKLKYASIEMAGDRTKGSIYSNMLAKMTIFTYENIAKMTAESSINIEDIGFGDKPIAVFLGIPDYDRSTHFLASVFIRQVYFVLAKKCIKTSKCKRQVKFVLNEFGNIPAIEAMANIITVCLGRNISFDLYIQSYSQISNLYGDDADTIIGNCGNQIYLMTNDDNTAEKFSKLIGNETVTDLQRSGNKLSLSKTITESTLEKPLLNPNELMELKEGHCVVKRVMKRRNRFGEKITPKPIFNCDRFGTTFKYRYMYMVDAFPNPENVNLDEVNHENRDYINPVVRVWDYNLTFKQFSDKERASIEPPQKRKRCLKDINRNNYKVLMDALKGTLGEEYLQIYGIDENMEINAFKDTISKISLKEVDRQAILTVINSERWDV